MKNVLPALILVGTLPATAYAQSMPEGFEYSGYVEFSSIHSDGDSETFARTEIDISYDNLFGNFGFSLGIDAFSFDGDSEAQLYPAITYSFGEQKVSVGMTRSVLDGGYLPMGQVLGSSYFDLQAAGANGSFVGTSLLLSGGDIRNLGARWDGTFGSTKVGLSYNRLDPDFADPADAFGLAIRHELDAISSAADMAFFVGIETVDGVGGSADSWIIGLEGQAERYGYGISVGETDFIFDRFARAWADYDVNDRLQLHAEFAFVDSGSTETLYSIGGTYNIWEGLEAELNYIDGSDFGDGLTEITLRYDLYKG